MSQTILLVDDEPNILHSLGRAFRKLPYKTYTSRSAEEAISILKAHNVDLIVSDENMPGMSGTKLLAWVAEHFPNIIRIVLTGQPSVSTAMQAINQGGVYSFLTKPCDLTELSILVRRALEQKEISDKNQRLLETTLNQLEDVEQAKAFVDLRIKDFRSRIEELEKEKSDARAAEHTQGEILATMSHEIRAPLTAILGYTDVLIHENWGIESTDSLEIIRRNGEYLLTLLNDILDLSKIDAGKVTAEHTDCSPCEILKEVASLFSQQAAAKGISLELQAIEEIPTKIQTDPIRLRQILTNLVSNAVKFTESGSVTLLAKMIEDDDTSTSKIQFDIIDTGIGLTAEQQSMIFSSYVQAENNTSHKYGGTGLGLVISQRLAELLGGTISVKSTPGEGSTFSVSLETESLAMATETI